MTENPSSLVAAPAGFPPLISVVHAEPTPYREATLPQTASTTNPLSYRGMTSSTAAPLTGYTGRYTQPDPIGLRTPRNVYSYASGNPLTHMDPLGLWTIRNSIVVKPVPSIDGVCPPNSGGACTYAGVGVGCDCEGCPPLIQANPTLYLGGTLYVFGGPFSTLRNRPKDPSVHDKPSAIAHEYNFHINHAVDAVRPYMDALDAETFQSTEQCQAACSETAKLVITTFGSTLRATQEGENGWRPR